MSDNTFSIAAIDRLSNVDASSFRPQTLGAKAMQMKHGNVVTADAEVTLSTSAQIQALRSRGAGVGELAAMFQVPISSVQDDLGVYPIATRNTIKPAPIADPNSLDPAQRAAAAKQANADRSDAHVELSTTAQVQSMSQSGANLQQIAAALGLTVSQVSEELAQVEAVTAAVAGAAKL